MKWVHVFNIPQYITSLELKHDESISKVAEASAENRIQVGNLQRELVLCKLKLEELEKYFKDVPQKNDIEKAEIPEIELNEEMRFPIVDGVKFKFEGEEGEGTPVKIY